jgi:predicted nucleotidyltransferase
VVSAENAEARAIPSKKFREAKRQMSVGTCEKILDEHVALARRRDASESQLTRVRSAFEASAELKTWPISVFCAGSLARREVGIKSDLDVFVTADKNEERLRSRLAEYTLFGELIQINKELGLPPFSNDGEYLKIHFLEDLEKLTGSRHDDSENQFTTRMLLILESEPLLNSGIYERHLRHVLGHYYRDEVGKRSFRPLFLLNDLLRYWRTLCLNYEERRHDQTKPWRKKNVNLKFSRMITVFSAVMPLIAMPTPKVPDVVAMCRQTPLRRLARSLDSLGDPRLFATWPKVLDLYEEFLTWKEDEEIERDLSTKEALVRQHAETLSTFLYDALNHSTIRPEYRRYLVL